MPLVDHLVQAVSPAQVKDLVRVARLDQAAEVDHHGLLEKRNGVNAATSRFSQIINHFDIEEMPNIGIESDGKKTPRLMPGVRHI